MARSDFLRLGFRPYQGYKRGILLICRLGRLMAYAIPIAVRGAVFGRSGSLDLPGKDGTECLRVSSLHINIRVYRTIDPRAVPIFWIAALASPSHPNCSA